MKASFGALSIILVCGTGCNESGNVIGGDGGGDTQPEVAFGSDAPPPTDAGPPPKDGGPVGEASVLTGHLHISRDGAYVVPQVTRAAAAGLKLDTKFKPTYTGQTYAQPLYVEDWKPGQDAVFVVTQASEVAAFDAKTGATLWDKSLGPPVPPSSLGCHQIATQPYGILSTPVIDPATRTLYTEVFTSPDDGTTKKHLAYALSIDDGGVRPGWPVDVGASVPGFETALTHERGSLLLLNGTLYLPYSGLGYDCDVYHGWIVGISTSDPKKVSAYSPAAVKGGVWGALSSDGTSVFFASGNSIQGTTTWGGGTAVIRLPPNLAFSGTTVDYFVPSNWQTLDDGDKDLGSSSLTLLDLPGVGSGKFAVAMGKWGVVHIVDRTNLGGVGTGNGDKGEGLFSARVVPESTGLAGNPAIYTTTKGTYVVLRADGPGSACPAGSKGDLIALKIAPTNPPTFSVAWCATSQGLGSPMVTTTDGKTDPIVWVASAQGTNLLLGFDGDTGETVFSGAGATMTQILRWTSPIVVNGRFFVGATGQMYAFDTP